MVKLPPLSPLQRAGAAALAMSFVASLVAVVVAVAIDQSTPEALGREAAVPEGLLAAWAGVGVVYAAGLLSLLPPLLLSGGGVQAAPLGFLAGMMVRLFGTLAGALVGAVVLDLEPKPFLLTLAATYLALLPAELIGLPRPRVKPGLPEG